MSAPPDRRTFAVSDDRRAVLRPIVERFGLDPDRVNWERLNRAFLHRSHRTEANLDEDNERLEFLGDSVIGLACTEYLLRENPASDEGGLSKVRAALVSRAILGRVGEDLGLGGLLLLGTGEDRSGGRQRASTLGSTLEAVCGAFHLDFPWEELRQVIWRVVIVPALAHNEGAVLVDHKSALQEHVQAELQRAPEYRVVGETGPDHAKIFHVEVAIDGRVLGRGEGPRKQVAENEAARDALKKLKG